MGSNASTITEKQVAKIRSFAWKHQKLSYPKMIDALGLCMSPENFRHIIANNSFYDPNYKPLPKRQTHVFKKAPRYRKRRAAFEYDFNCRVCGMGFDKRADAERCCRREITQPR